MMIAGVFALWVVFQLVAKYFKLWIENCRQIAAKLPPNCRHGTGVCVMCMSSLNEKTKVNYPETKDFGASWAGQSNLWPYLHTLEFPPFQRYLIC